MDRINSVGPIQDSGSIGKIAGSGAQKAGDVSFKDVMKNFLSDVNEMQNKADESIQKMVAGEITDVHQVMSTVEEANTAFNMMMEIRNKVMDAYQELMRVRL
jgi:flagellar hook-basal body complex protein FliE